MPQDCKHTKRFVVYDGFICTDCKQLFQGQAARQQGDVAIIDWVDELATALADAQRADRHIAKGQLALARGDVQNIAAILERWAAKRSRSSTGGGELPRADADKNRGK